MNWKCTLRFRRVRQSSRLAVGSAEEPPSGQVGTLRSMAMEPTPLPRPRESFELLCIRCGGSLYYVRQDRAAGVFEHRFECRRCGQKHAAWSYDWGRAATTSRGRGG